jgi:hypothetical protein
MGKSANDNDTVELGRDGIAINRAIGNYKAAVKQLEDAKFQKGKAKATILAQAIGWATMGDKNVQDALLEEV